MTCHVAYEGPFIIGDGELWAQLPGGLGQLCAIVRFCSTGCY